MAAKNDLSAFFNQVIQRREGFLDTSVVSNHHGAVHFIQRDIEIHAHKTALTGHIDITDTFFGHNEESWKEVRRDKLARIVQYAHKILHSASYIRSGFLPILKKNKNMEAKKVKTTKKSGMVIDHPANNTQNG